MTTTKSPTFPVVGKGVRRNAETGVEIHNDSDGWYVKTFHADKGDLFSQYASQADARTAAAADVKIMREQIAEAHAEALTEADRIEQAEEANGGELTEYARKQFPSVAAMIENAPAGSAHGAPDLRDESDRDRDVNAGRLALPWTYDGQGNRVNPTDADRVYTQAQAIRDAIPAVYRTSDVLTAIGRSMTSLRPADALRHAERARDLVAAREYRKPETDAKRVSVATIAAALAAAAPRSLTSPGQLEAATAETDLPDLLALDTTLTTRIVNRAAYDALRAMLAVIDRWIQAAREDCDARGHTSHGGDYGVCGKAFASDDIRRMVNDAARLFGTREPYSEAS